MSFLKQYRVYMTLMSLIGLAPFYGIYSSKPRIRVFVPLFGYTVFLIVITPIFATSFIRKLMDHYELEMVIRLIVQLAYFLILSCMYTLVLLSAIILAPSQAQFVNSLEIFHNKVCNLESNNERNYSVIIRCVCEAIVCNSIWSIGLFHMHLLQGTIVDAIVNSVLVFVVMTFISHVRTVACLMSNDLQVIRCRLFTNNNIFDEQIFKLYIEFVHIKQVFESVFGQTLMLCAAFDLIMSVIVVYMFVMMAYVIGQDMLSWLDGMLGYVCPLIVKNVLLVRACNGIAHEVGSVRVLTINIQLQISIELTFMDCL